MSETPLLNDAAARSPTGEILDQSQIPPTTPTPEPTPPSPPAEPLVEAKKEGESLLNDKEKKEEAVGAPEKYEEFKLPEGFALEETALATATALFKKHNLPQSAAQELVDFHVKSTQEAFDAPFNLWKETQENWKNEIKNDPKVGHRLAEVKTNFGRMLDGLGDQKLAAEFRQAMDYTGAGNNPAFIRFIDAVSKRLVEGGHIAAPRPANVVAPNQTPGPSAHAVYPNLK